MNIYLDRTEANSVNTHTNIDRDTTSNIARTSTGTGNVQRSGFLLDISGTVMDNSAYAGHGRTVEDVMLAAGQQDITARRNYMAVMSNCMSDQDFARLSEDGFHPGSTDIETVVTIVDHIKAELMKGGTQVVGYTDTVDQDVLKDITGSQVFADSLRKEFAKRDLPVTQENVTAVMKAWKVLSQVDGLAEGSVKYMIENDLIPSAENLYMARFSATEDGSRQGRGYYAAGSVAGYYAKKPENIEFEQLLPQMKKVIQEAGFLATEENMAGARWLIEKGIPLNTDTFSAYHGIYELTFPVGIEDFLQTAACAIADGNSPAKADLNQKESTLEKAAALAELTAKLPEEAADVITSKDLPFTLRNLFAAWEELGGSKEAVAAGGVTVEAEGSRDALEPVQIDSRLLKGRRLLEEVRLSMTIEANLRLLKSGYQIETASLEELVGKLKEAENSYEMSLTGKTQAKDAAKEASLYKESLQILQRIRTSPIAIAAQVSETDTLSKIQELGHSRSVEYQKAGETYEALMTAPRKDMGDSIQKAFGNVDDILTDLNFALTEENRRAVRILGYNHMELSRENIRKISEKDRLLTGVVEEMKPGRLLHMIRQNINPMSMPLEQLREYLQQTDPVQEIESYSKFLYQLEKRNDITEEERSAYIGVYRLLRQIEKNDDAAIGALWQTGAEFTLENLLSAVRSSRHGRMDYTVNDDFGGVMAKAHAKESITEQLSKAFAGSDAVGFTALKEELGRLIEEAGQQEAAREFETETYDLIRKSVKVLSGEEAVLQQLSDYGQIVTADTMTAARTMLKEPESTWKKLKDLEKETSRSWKDKGEEASKLDTAGEAVIDALSDKESAGTAYQGLVEMVQDMIEQAAYLQQDSLDVKALGSLYKQVTFMGSMAREENYEIPVNIDGALTSINLKLIHNSQEESKAMITFTSEAFGKTAAQFRLSDQEISGFCICASKEGAEYLRDNKVSLETRFSKEKISAGEIYFATEENMSLEEISLNGTKGRQQVDGARTLYQAARAFIGFVQEMGSKKGREVYEN